MKLDVGHTLRIIRQAKGLKIGVVAKAAAVSTPFLSLIERGQREPSMAVLRRLAVALGVPVEAIFMAALPEGEKMHTTDRQANRLVGSIRELALAERKLRNQLKDANNGHEAKGTRTRAHI
jgi:transcriptional regulator with XRE-family HTH domain